MYVAAPVVEQGKIIGVLSVGKPNSAMAPVIHRSERRILWAAADIVENRPPLSRWHPDYTEAFAAFVRTWAQKHP